ncbi:hypothetical protein FO519_007393 [Halicephalobus sp. NKZ332]|nr:hypothetical protein FO519_007393 [Halicephalobus sp. NKZ332]
MSSLAALYGSPQKKLPSVNTVFRQNREYFSSEIYRERSTFVCEESLHESPSTSTGFFPLREIQPGSSRFHGNSAPTVVFQHYTNSQRLKPSSPLSSICSSRKRRFVEARLNVPRRNFVSAKVDRLIHGAEENLKKLLENEFDFLPNLDSMKKIQTEISLEFRKSAVIWLEEVCIETGIDVVVFPLAISYMDRFLSLQFVPKNNLQHLASACLLVAGKVKAPAPLKIDAISRYTDGAVSEVDLVEWELLVISTLNWQFLAPTAFEFLDQLLTRSYEVQQIREPFRRICYRLQQDETLAALRPSLQAIFCSGFAAIESNDEELFCEIEAVCTSLFNVPIPAFRTGVNRVGTLFYNVPVIRNPTGKTEIPFSEEEFEVVADDEGSPRKIRRISEEEIVENGIEDELPENFLETDSTHNFSKMESPGKLLERSSFQKSMNKGHGGLDQNKQLRLFSPDVADNARVVTPTNEKLQKEQEDAEE